VGVGEGGGEITQTLYAHMNKRKKAENKQTKKEHMLCASSF
jgi:hypothetical protein